MIKTKKMKIDIKFRGIKKSDGEMIYGDFNYFDGKVYIFNREDSFNSTDDYEVIPESLGQFTGLKDKHGKDIYKGDLLAIGVNDFGMMHSNYEVTFEGCDYILKRVDLTFNWGRLSRLSEMNWECEIIGNIHEKKQ
jgi:uncharacterized phage protein (TIGR01671 family)